MQAIALWLDLAAATAVATPLLAEPTWLWQHVVHVQEQGGEALTICSYILALVLVAIALVTLVVVIGPVCGGGGRGAAKTATSLERAALFFHLVLFAGLSLVWVYERVGVAGAGPGVWAPLAGLGGLTLVSLLESTAIGGGGARVAVHVSLLTCRPHR